MAAEHCSAQTIPISVAFGVVDRQDLATGLEYASYFNRTRCLQNVFTCPARYANLKAWFDTSPEENVEHDSAAALGLRVDSTCRTTMRAFVDYRFGKPLDRCGANGKQLATSVTSSHFFQSDLPRNLAVAVEAQSRHKKNRGKLPVPVSSDLSGKW